MENEAINVTVGTMVENAGTAVDGLLSIGTKIFNWALTNPMFMLTLVLVIIFAVVGLIRKFAH